MLTGVGGSPNGAGGGVVGRGPSYRCAGRLVFCTQEKEQPFGNAKREGESWLSLLNPRPGNVVHMILRAVVV
jgi:hypothetical protein